MLGILTPGRTPHPQATKPRVHLGMPRKVAPDAAPRLRLQQRRRGLIAEGEARLRLEAEPGFGIGAQLEHLLGGDDAKSPRAPRLRGQRPARPQRSVVGARVDECGAAVGSHQGGPLASRRRSNGRREPAGLRAARTALGATRVWTGSTPRSPATTTVDAPSRPLRARQPSSRSISPSTRRRAARAGGVPGPWRVSSGAACERCSSSSAGGSDEARSSHATATSTASRAAPSRFAAGSAPPAARARSSTAGVEASASTPSQVSPRTTGTRSGSSWAIAAPTVVGQPSAATRSSSRAATSHRVGAFK